MKTSAQRKIERIRYLYHNDTFFNAALHSMEIPLNDFIVRVLNDESHYNNLFEEYLKSYRARARKIMKQQIALLGKGLPKGRMLSFHT